jgi:hypothetical protein
MLRGGRRRGRVTGEARSRPCGAAQRSCAGAGPFPFAGAQFSLDCILLLGGGGWCCCGVATHAALSVEVFNSRTPSSTSSSTLGLSHPVLSRRLWLVVGWVGFLSDVIGGVRSGPGVARTMLLFHTISARPPKQPRMVRTFLEVHTRSRLAYALRYRAY